MHQTDPKHNPEPMHPVLVEVTRGPIVDSVHHGVVAVADVNGSLVAWAGNPGLVTYYRSSSKPIQAIALVEGGGADHFGLTPAEIAITCGSHGGEDIHVAAVRSILEKIGVGEDALACGTHMPYDKAAAFALESRAEGPKRAAQQLFRQARGYARAGEVQRLAHRRLRDRDPPCAANHAWYCRGVRGAYTGRGTYRSGRM